MAALLEEASADQDDPWIVDSAETDAAEDVVAEAKDVVEDDESAAELSADAEAAQEAGNGEEEQLQAFRSMLGSMFGIKKPGDDLTDGPKAVNDKAVGNGGSGEGHSIEEPAIIQEPSWVRNVTPDGPKVDRASARSDETESAN
jgi:hypothetical protein